MGLRFPARFPLVVALLLGLAALPKPARAAEMTRVASSFDKDNPFDLDLWVGFEYEQRRAKITREHYQEGHIADVLELRYRSVTYSMPMRIAIGLYHDLEVHASASYIFAHDAAWWYPAEKNPDGSLAVSDANSTIHNNCLNRDGSPTSPNCLDGSGDGAQPIFNIPGESHRGGLSDITVGLSWAPFSDERDDTKPKWVLTFDYTAPSAAVDQPWQTTTSDARGAVGDGAHRFTFSTAISKRLGAIDPYMKLTYTYPLASGASISNCDPHALPDQNLANHNCDVGPFTKGEVGLKPPHVGGLLFGAEFMPYDNPAKKQRVSIDIQFGALFISEGRQGCPVNHSVYSGDYGGAASIPCNEMADAIGKQLYSEEYFTVGGSFSVYARPVEYVQLRLNASLYTDTEHFLTGENIGKDLDGSGKVDLGSPPAISPEVSPTYDFRYDMPGRRFRISETSIFSVMVTGTVNF